MGQSARQQTLMNVNQIKSIPEKGKDIKPTKPERTPEETANLKRAFQLGFNDYKVGEVSNDTTFDKLHTHVFQGDGDYIVVNNRIGQFISRMREIDRPGLPINWGKNYIKLKVPKMPGLVYHQIIAFFRAVMKKHSNAEAFIQLYYDLQDKRYVCHVPEQTVSQGSVDYDAEKDLNQINRNRYIFVFEIHSHNNMGAFFSGIDNGDEKETKFYGVLGKLGSETIEEEYRYLVMGKEFRLKKEDIFDFSGENVVSKEDLNEFLNTQEGEEIDKEEIIKFLAGTKISFPKKWLKRVNKRAYTTYNTGRSGGHGYLGGTNKTEETQNDSNDPYENDSWHTGNYGDPEKKGSVDEKTGEITSYNGDTPSSDYIDDLFNLEEYEEEDHQAAIEAFTASLDPNHVVTLMEALVDHGHDGLIQQFARG